MPAFRLRKYQGPGSSLIDAYQNWRQQEPSVTDAPWEAPARKVANVAEFFMPSETDIQSEMPVGPAAPLISIFKNKIAREAGTRKFLDSLLNFYNKHREEAGGSEMFNRASKNIELAGINFANRYPRIAAHMRLAPDAVKREGASAFVSMPEGKVKKPLDMTLTEIGMHTAGDDYPGALKQATDLMFHEGTHVAQSLGNRKAKELYTLADRFNRQNRLMDSHEAYWNNPFEQSARYSGARNAGYTYEPRGYRPAVKRLAELTEGEALGPGGNVNRVLRRRGTIPTPPPPVKEPRQLGLPRQKVAPVWSDEDLPNIKEHIENLYGQGKSIAELRNIFKKYRLPFMIEDVEGKLSFTPRKK